MKVAIGLKAHSGWAVVVVVGRANDSLQLIERSRIELVRAQDTPWGRAPYHAGQPLDPDAARELVQHATAGAQEAAVGEKRRLLHRLRQAGHEVAGCAVLVGHPMPSWTTEQILAVHVRMHQAEGALFPAALSMAAEACGLPLRPVAGQGLAGCAAGGDVAAM